MADGIRKGDPRGFNKGCSSKLRESSRVRQTPKEGRRTYRLKRCRNNNKDEDNSPKTLNDKNQASSQKFKQLDRVVYILLRANAPWKDMNIFLLHLSIRKQLATKISLALI